MPLIETDSLVIKSYNLAEADRIIVLFTRDHGVVRGVAKGAKRLRSRFGSGLEPFSEIRVSYFQKDNVELVSIQQADILRSNFGAASEPAFLQKFAYLADLIVWFLPPHDPNETMYRMVRATVETAVSDPLSLDAVGLYFELWLLRLAGFLPEWSRCEICGRVPEDHEEANVQANFHLLCSNCRRAVTNRVVSGAERHVFNEVMRLSPTEFAGAGFDRDAIRNLSQISKEMISSALGRPVHGDIPLAA